MTGIDYSQRSIDYAVRSAREQGLAIRYRYENYLDLADRHLYDAALLIYGDFCPLPLSSGANYWRMYSMPSSLGGSLCWMIRPASIGSHESSNGWYIMESGFWKPGWHLVLKKGFDYPEQAIYLN